MAIRRARRFALGLVVALAAAAAVASAQGGGRGGFGGGGGQAPGAGRGAGPGRGGFPPRDNSTTTAVGTASISGTVVLDASGTAVKRARVMLSGAELRGGRSVVTDDQGRFAFQALPAGRFTMTASKPGFVDGTYGAKRPGRPGTPIQLNDGQTLEHATIVLPRGAVITGVVVDESGEPAVGTQVRALRYVMRTGERTLQQAGQAVADDRGIYRIYQLLPGDYVVNALPRNMTSNDLRQSLVVEVQSLMQQAQTMSGRGGGPVDVTGLATLAASGGGNTIMDRVAQLQQQLSQVDQEPSTAYAPVFYPGTTSPASATTVTIAAGEEHGGVDFQLQLVSTWRVNGIVTSPNGALPQGTQVALISAERPTTLGPIFGLDNQARVAADGKFTFSGVTPGQYTLQARGLIRQPETAGAAQNAQNGGGFGPFGGRGGFNQGPIAQVLWAAADVSVGGQNLADIVLNLQPGLTVGGRVAFEGAGAPADLTRVRVSISPRGPQLFEIGGTPPGTTDATGHFTIPGVAPGRYTISASVMPATASANGQGNGFGGGRGATSGVSSAGGTATQWTLKSAIVDGRDVLDFPLDIAPGANISNATLTFTDKSQELSGTLQDASGRPTSDFTIILFSADPTFWGPQSRRIASARPGTDGRFTIRGMPAGSYRLTAVTDAEPGEWYDPAFLGQVQQASIAIRIDEGEKKTQDIRLASAQ